MYTYTGMTRQDDTEQPNDVKPLVLLPTSLTPTS